MRYLNVENLESCKAAECTPYTSAALLTSIDWPSKRVNWEIPINPPQEIVSSSHVNGILRLVGSGADANRFFSIDTKNGNIDWISDYRRNQNYSADLSETILGNSIELDENHFVAQVSTARSQSKVLNFIVKFNVSDHVPHVVWLWKTSVSRSIQNFILSPDKTTVTAIYEGNCPYAQPERWVIDATNGELKTDTKSNCD